MAFSVCTLLKPDGWRNAKKSVKYQHMNEKNGPVSHSWSIRSLKSSLKKKLLFRRCLNCHINYTVFG